MFAEISGLWNERPRWTSCTERLIDGISQNLFYFEAPTTE